MALSPERIAGNLAAVRSRIESASKRAGRAPGSVKLVAVTKTVDVDAVRILTSLGVMDCGENRVQELARKAGLLADSPIRWHMIGHLQRNKAKDILPHCRIVHSVESEELAEVLSRRAADADLEIDVLLEVDIAGEESKYGLAPGSAAVLADHVARLGALRLRGLMTMAPIAEDPETVRPVFARLRELASSLSRNLPAGAMSELSMGMTQDFEVAIDEGATMVRVGSALFA